MPRLRDDGFTLAETLVAISLIAIGLVGVSVAMSLQSGGVASRLNFGIGAVSRGTSYSTGVQLAQSRVEEIRNAPYVKDCDSGAVVTDQITAVNFPNESYGSIAGFPGYRRTVSIENGTPVANAKRITLRTFFRPQNEQGIGPEESVLLTTIVSARCA